MSNHGNPLSDHGRRTCLGFVAACCLTPALAPSTATARSHYKLCPNVVGGALYRTQALNTSCSEAQRVWHHFAWSGGPRPPLIHGWRCSSRITGNEESRTSCARGSQRLDFYED
jgi:hypothetical protein